jgi:hypothetical protein
MEFETSSREGGVGIGCSPSQSEERKGFAEAKEMIGGMQSEFEDNGKTLMEILAQNQELKK